MDENKKENKLVPEPEQKEETDLGTPEESPALSDTAESTTDVSSDNSATVVEETIDEAAVQEEADDLEPYLNEIVSQPPESVENLHPSKPGKKSHKKFWAIFGSVIAALVVIVAAAYFIIDPFTAVTVGKNKISVSEYEYYFKTTVSQSAKNYTEYGLDTSKDLKEQECPLKNEDGSSMGTWQDFFDLQVKTNLQTIFGLYDEAKSKKETLTAEAAKEIDDTMKSIRDAATKAGQSFSEYMAETYGTKVDEQSTLRILQVESLANQYREEFAPAKDYSDQEIQEYYNKNKDNLDAADIRYFPIVIDTEKTDGDAAAKAKANAMLSKISNDKTFAEQARANATKEQADTFKDDASTLLPNLTKDKAAEMYVPDEITGWAFDRTRKIGDKIVVSDGSAYYVLYMVSPLHQDISPTVDVRHTLIQFETENGEKPTAAQKKAAKDKVDGLYKKWLEGDKTQDSFAKLATDNSQDTGSATNGGLYEDVYKGQMVAAFDNWCFDSSRKSGDTGIVETSYGYHIIYFVEKGTRLNWMNTAENNMIAEAKYNSLKSLMENTKYKVNKIGMKSVDMSI